MPAEDSGLTAEQRNAADSASSYLDFSGFSRKGLIDQLEFEGYSKADATAAVDSLDVDWNEQARRSAESYLDTMAFSLSELIDQLEFEGYTASQADFGANAAYSGTGEGGADSGSGGTVSQQNAVRSAESYLDTMAFSRSGLIDQLVFEGYSEADATFAVDSITVDWNEQARRSAESYLETMPFSRSGLIDQLMFEGYTQSQATYGVDAAGL